MIEKCTACGWLIDLGCCGCDDGRPKEVVTAPPPPYARCRTYAQCSGRESCPREPSCVEPAA